VSLKNGEKKCAGTSTESCWHARATSGERVNNVPDPILLFRKSTCDGFIPGAFLIRPSVGRANGPKGRV
jgi:hypothetical protein